MHDRKPQDDSPYDQPDPFERTRRDDETADQRRDEREQERMEVRRSEIHALHGVLDDHERWGAELGCDVWNRAAAQLNAAARKELAYLEAKSRTGIERSGTG